MLVHLKIAATDLFCGLTIFPYYAMQRHGGNLLSHQSTTISSECTVHLMSRSGHYDANACLNVVRHIEVMEISLWNLFKLQSKPTFRDDFRWHGHCILTHRIILYSPRVLIDLLSTFLKQTWISKDGHTYLTDSFKCSRFVILKLRTWNTP